MSAQPQDHLAPCKPSRRKVVLRWAGLFAAPIVTLVRRIWRQPSQIKGLKALYKLALLVIAGVAGWFLDFKQENYADIYVKELLTAHHELRLESLDMKGDRAYVNLEISLDRYPDAASDRRVQSLASSMTNIYCNHVNEAKELEIPLFNVNIRATGNDESRFILSRAFSRESCA